MPNLDTLTHKIGDKDGQVYMPISGRFRYMHVK